MAIVLYFFDRHIIQKLAPCSLVVIACASSFSIKILYVLLIEYTYVFVWISERTETTLLFSFNLCVFRRFREIERNEY